LAFQCRIVIDVLTNLFLDLVDLFVQKVQQALDTGTHTVMRYLLPVELLRAQFYQGIAPGDQSFEDAHGYWRCLPWLGMLRRAVGGDQLRVGCVGLASRTRGLTIGLDLRRVDDADHEPCIAQVLGHSLVVNPRRLHADVSLIASILGKPGYERFMTARGVGHDLAAKLASWQSQTDVDLRFRDIKAHNKVMPFTCLHFFHHHSYAQVTPALMPANLAYAGSGRLRPG